MVTPTDYKLVVETLQKMADDENYMASVGELQAIESVLEEQTSLRYSKCLEALHCLTGEASVAPPPPQQKDIGG
jgi:hypothetical protein